MSDTLELDTCSKCGAQGVAFICDTPGCPVNGGADYGPTYEFRVMDRTGDGIKTTWNPNNETEVAEARRTFNSYRERNFDVFRLNEDDERGGRITEFDPHAGSMLASPRLVGG